MFKKVKDSPLWLAGGLILFVYGGYEFIRLAVIPHVQKYI